MKHRLNRILTFLVLKENYPHLSNCFSLPWTLLCKKLPQFCCRKTHFLRKHALQHCHVSVIFIFFIYLSLLLSQTVSQPIYLYVSLPPAEKVFSANRYPTKHHLYNQTPCCNTFLLIFNWYFTLFLSHFYTSTLSQVFSAYWWPTKHQAATHFFRLYLFICLLLFLIIIYQPNNMLQNLFWTDIFYIGCVWLI